MGQDSNGLLEYVTEAHRDHCYRNIFLVITFVLSSRLITILCFYISLCHFIFLMVLHYTFSHCPALSNSGFERCLINKMYLLTAVASHKGRSANFYCWNILLTLNTCHGPDWHDLLKNTQLSNKITFSVGPTTLDTLQKLTF